MLNSVSINHCRYFLTVAETGSFRLAAERMYRSQPAISLGIKELEQHLGHQLMIRSNPVCLTAFGNKCLPLIRQLVQNADFVSSTLESMARNDSGYLSLASIMSAAAHKIPDLIAAYQKQYPNIIINIRDDNSEGVERMLLQGQVELGICSVVDDHPLLSFDPLYKDEFGLICHHQHPLAKETEVSWQDIAKLPHIGTTAHKQLTNCKEAQFLYDRRLQVTNMLTLIAMLKRNLGVTVLARLGLPPDHPDLVFVPITSPRMERVIGLRMRKDLILSPSAESMKSLIMEGRDSIL